MNGDLQVILADLQRIARCFDFTRNRMGDGLLDIAAAGVRSCMDSQTDPDGQPWPDLDPRYEEWKVKNGYPATMAILHGVMKTEENIRGERVLSETEATMTFGLDAQSRQEADWFQERGREFYGITTAAAELCGHLCDAVIVAAIP